MTNTRRLIAENKADVIVGSSITPSSLAMINIVAAAQTPMISLAAASRIVEPVDAQRRWVFKPAQDDIQMVTAVIEHMSSHGVETVGFIGFSDAYGAGWWQRFSRIAEVRNLKIVANERYSRVNTSVAAHVGKIVAANPDAVLIAGAGTPAALPQKALKQRGYQGVIYQTHGAAGADFLRVCGTDCEGTFLPAAPLLVAAQLPDANPVKRVALEYLTVYESAHGQGSVSAFGAHAWDAGIMLQHAIPLALQRAQPGTKEFRAELRDALEGLKDVVGVHGVFNMSSSDHVGLDQRARVMVQILDGNWKLVE